MGATAEVCLVGNLCIDLLVRDVPSLPAWGRETAGNGRSIVASGQTTYTALALARLGVPTAVVGRVGGDHWGTLIVDELSTAGIDTRGVDRLEGEQTALTIGVIRPDGERAFISDFACLGRPDDDLFERHAELIGSADIVALLGNFSFPGLDLEKAGLHLTSLRDAGKQVLLDTGWDPDGFQPATVARVKSLLRGVSIFLPNESEACACAVVDDVEAAARRLLEAGPELVVIKLGQKGVFAADRKRTLRVAAFPVDPVSTVGAGDVFNAGFIYGLRAGWELERWLIAGNAAAATRVAGHDGTSADEAGLLSMVHRRSRIHSP